MDEKTDIIKQLEIKITQAIATQNASALNHLLAELTKAYKTFAIFELYITIKCEIFQHTNANFLAHTAIPREKMTVLRWLEATLKNSPYQLSIMLVRADIALYNNKLDNACKLFRQTLMLYIKFLKENNLTISSIYAWNWMLKYAVFTEPVQAEVEPYQLPSLQLPDSLINKAPQTIITAYGNAPYIQKFAERFTCGITELMPDVEMLLVVGNEAQDTDAETQATIIRLQQQFPKLHFANETIPQVFQQKHLLHTYCTCRRFTYLQDIIAQSKCDQLITIDIDLYIKPMFKRCVEYVTDTPISHTSVSNNIFTGDSIFYAQFLKVDASPISEKYCAQTYDYLTRKFASNHLLWVVDQYALFHAWQNALTHEEQNKCRNINDLDTDESSVNDLYFGFEDDKSLYTKESIEKKLADSRFMNIFMLEDIGFDEQTLRPILHRDWDK